MGPVRPVGPVKPVEPEPPTLPPGPDRLPTGPTRPTGPSLFPLAATGILAKADSRFPCDLRASEIYLLLLAAFIGPEEPVYGGGKLSAIRDLDRFRLRLEYADGTADECLPLNVAMKQFGVVAGPQIPPPQPTIPSPSRPSSSAISVSKPPSPSPPYGTNRRRAGFS